MTQLDFAIGCNSLIIRKIDHTAHGNPFAFGPSRHFTSRNALNIISVAACAHMAQTAHTGRYTHFRMLLDATAVVARFRRLLS